MKRSLLLLVVVAATAGAQAPRPCRVTWGELPPTSRSEWINLPGGKIQLFVGGGFRAWCAGTSIVVTSDSAEYYEEQQLVHLIGNATYTEDGARLNADRIRYNAGSDYLEATGNVRMRSGNSTMTASHVMYFRRSPGRRNENEAYATGRPQVRIRDTAAAAADTGTTVIDADRLRMVNDSMYYGGGNVVITRPDLVANADSIETDKHREMARLLGGPPRVVGSGESAFRLEGRVLDVFGRERQLARVLAMGDADAVSDSLRLTADTIDMRMSKNRIDSVAAWSAGRARAVAPQQDIVAGRIHISMPGQRLRALFASGRARVETRPDSAIITDERDWLVGDSVAATFVSRTVRDTATETALESLTAWGNAQSFYQVPPDPGSDSLPSLSYVAGGRIIVAFTNGEIASVRVLDEVRGILLEPIRGDTTRVRREPPGARRR